MVNDAPSIFFHITNACNLKCKHCCVDSSKPLKDELSTSEIKKLFDEFKRMGVSRIVIGGGEPLLRPDIFEVVRYGVERGMKVTIETNASLLSKSRLRLLKKIGLTALNISLDGLKPRTHDSFRGEKGLFKSVIGQIRYAVKIGLKVVVWCCASNYNLDEAVKLPRFLSDMGVKYLYYLNFSPMGRGEKHREFIVSPERWKGFCNELNGERNTLGKRITIGYETTFLTESEIRAGKEIEPCMINDRKVCQLMANGDVFPCVLLLNNKRFCLGNIRDKSFSEIWFNSPRWSMFSFSATDSRCKKCRYVDSCKGGCKAYAYAFSKSTSARDPRCKEGFVPICPCCVNPPIIRHKSK